MNGETKMSSQRFLSLSLLATGLLLSGVATAQTYSKTETITYHDNTDKWVLGQTASVTCNVSVPASTACNGDVVSANTFDPTYALPLTTSAFGKLQQTLTYDITSTVVSGQRGTLKTVSDGRDSGTYNTTVTLAGWVRGIPELITYPDGTAQSADVNPHGWINWVKNEAGFTTSYTYDPMGRLASINYPDEPDLSYYNTNITFEKIAVAGPFGLPAGHWRQVVDTGNSRQVSYYDAMWRPVVENRYDQSNETNTQSYTVKRYNASGRLAFQSYPRNSVANYTDTTLPGVDTLYDALGRVTYVNQDSELGVLQAKTEYPAGFQTRTTNPRGQVTTTSYQAWDQPITDFPILIDHPEGTRTTIARDAFGKPTSLRRHNDANTVGITRTYTYTSAHELCRSDEPETGTTAMGYDAAGNLLWSASGYRNVAAGCLSAASVAARRADRTYDQRNRLLTLSFPNGVGDQIWSYTPDGLPQQVVTYNDPNMATPVINGYHYNRRRLLTEESTSQPGWYTWSIGYSYDHNGHLASHIYPGNVVVNYLPNALGQPTQLGAYATGVSYFSNGGIKQFTYGNGIVHTLTQNARQLPDRSLDAYGTTKYLDDGYDYDANANVAAITDGATGRNQRGNRTMTYDGLDRLKTVASPMYGTTGASYTYDALDNLTRVVAPGRDHYYCYDGYWQLTNIKTASCSGATVVGIGYDPQGNLSNKNGQDYMFTFGNRLWAVPGKESYRYDGHGRRVLSWSATGLGNVLSQYDSSGVLRYQYDARKGKELRYLYLGGSLVAMQETPFGTANHTIKYQHTDALGSPVVVTDANRNVLERSEYEPYGQVLNRPVSDGPGYTGHVMDAATGLAYMQQRYYDPMIGRFLSVDPVTADGAKGANFNRYWYGNNNPYRFTDPDGRYSCAGDGCDRIDTTVTAMRVALGQMSRGTSDFNRMQRIVTAIGEKGEAGPQYQTGALEGEAAAAYSQDTHITTVDLSKADSTPYLAMNLGHEVTHEIDQASRNGTPTKTVGEVRKTETNAYRNGAVVAKALGVNIPANEVRRGIESSVNRWESRQKKEEKLEAEKK